MDDSSLAQSMSVELGRLTGMYQAVNNVVFANMKLTRELDVKEYLLAFWKKSGESRRRVRYVDDQKQKIKLNQ